MVGREIGILLAIPTQPPWHNDVGREIFRWHPHQPDQSHRLPETPRENTHPDAVHRMQRSMPTDDPCHRLDGYGPKRPCLVWMGPMNHVRAIHNAVRPDRDERNKDDHSRRHLQHGVSCSIARRHQRLLGGIHCDGGRRHRHVMNGVGP